MATKKTTQTMARKKQPTTAKRGTSKKPNVRKTPAKKRPSLIYEIVGLVLVAIAFITMFQFGLIGRVFQGFSKLLIGNWYVLVPVFMIWYAIYLMVVRALPVFKNRYIWGVICLLCSVTLFSHIAMFHDLYNGEPLERDASILSESWGLIVQEKAYIEPDGFLGGGLLGAVLYAVFHSLVDTTGSKIVALLCIAIGLILLTGKALVPYLMEQIPKWREEITKRRDEVMYAREERNEQETSVDSEITKPQRALQQTKKVVEEKTIAQPAAEKPALSISAYTQNLAREEEPSTVTKVPKVEEDSQVEEDNLLPEVGIIENEAYVLPKMDLLALPPTKDQSAEFEVIEQNARTIEQTLDAFGVQANVTEVHLGPAVTEYEVLPERGVKVSKIVNLQDDMALALAAKDIRIEAPIPGKSAVGIEVPNKEISMVSLRSVLEASPSNKADEKLVVGLGRDISGKAKLTKLNKMPHLLVAGSTGSGKSVCINSIIVSILMRAKPHEVKMMMIDPKMVELSVYNGVPHLLAPVVTDARKASEALKKVVSEMERRYDLFAHTGTRNIEGYNKHIDRFNEKNDEKHPHLPFIVVIVDELADLMLVAAGDVEDSIMRLAQMARAAGIHLIIATQRPSVNVITGVIKANIPSRIAFAVSSQIDSRTILDTGGAERLLGRGDMLFLPSGESKPTRVQGAFVSDEEVQEIVEYVISQQKAQYQDEMIPTDEDIAPEVAEDTDELYHDAVRLVVEQDNASVSFLQRKLKIGYARAARIMDQMEERGVVGPSEKSKPRQILISK
ncbi:DNA translocase FtsK [Kurthia huakuii]|uniref:DNA translocase FtsK n=2 Tax=Kurthia huakuii TaxID=1421019 RepID=UPI0004ACB58E|nr:DNA translocase FtsK [Kurthia huakuii]MBM7698275.1 S-DNA-T family DNA segregation ATPase FtsK/SpoIIIE [Kurthia huakuii]